MISSSLLLLLATSVSVLLLITITFAVTAYSVPDNTVVKVSASCHDKILEYARMEFYTDAVTVKAATASCGGV